MEEIPERHDVSQRVCQSIPKLPKIAQLFDQLRGAMIPYHTIARSEIPCIHFY